MGRKPSPEEVANLSPSIIESGVVKSLIKHTAKNKLTSVEARKAIYTHYDDFFSINDHYSDNADPLSLVEVTEAESLCGKDTTLARRASKFIDLNIRKYLGLTFYEYLELPRSEQEIINLVCEETLKREAKAKKDLIKDIEEIDEDM